MTIRSTTDLDFFTITRTKRWNINKNFSTVCVCDFRLCQNICLNLLLNCIACIYNTQNFVAYFGVLFWALTAKSILNLCRSLPPLVQISNSAHTSCWRKFLVSNKICTHFHSCRHDIPQIMLQISFYAKLPHPAISLLSCFVCPTSPSSASSSFHYVYFYANFIYLSPIFLWFPWRK